MTTATYDTKFAEHSETLREMSSILQSIAADSPGIDITELLERAGAAFGTTPSQMKYALSFAGVKKLVKIDYDSATVSAL